MKLASQAAAAPKRAVICNQAVTGTSAQNGNMFRVRKSHRPHESAVNENLVHAAPLSRRGSRKERLSRADRAQRFAGVNCGIRNTSGDPWVPAKGSICADNAERSRYTSFSAGTTNGLR